jgi:MSHA pilin protein MshC
MPPPQPHPAAPRSARGFTLIELIMVLVILGTLAVFVLPRIELARGFDEVGFQNAVRGTLEYARKSAVAQRRNVRVTLAGNNLTLTIDDVGPEAAGAGTFPRNLPLPTPDRRCTGGQLNQLCAPAGATFTLGGPATLDFSPLGRASASAVYTVTNQPNITVVQETGHVF